MTELVLAEEQVVTRVSRDELIDALSPGRVAEFLERHPGRTREFYVTADGMVVSAAPGDRETRAIRDSEVVLFARRLKKRHLDLRA
jgi:hypothetical protein